MTALLEKTTRKPGAGNRVVDPALAAARFVSRLARVPRRRTMRQFAEQEFILPSGPYEGQRFRCDRQPWTRLWFDAIDQADAHGWNSFAVTAITQGAKTTAAFHITTLYHLFEVGERVIIGLPDEDMAADKWFMDLRPVIERTKYRDLLPKVGGGSRGGKVHLIQFGNGAALKFMTAGGRDKSRAHYTARVVIFTETDGMDTASGGSRESDPISQIEARTRAYGDRKRIYKECTASTELGHIWNEWKDGTQSSIALCCPVCHDWNVPRLFEGDPPKILHTERKLLRGWENADDELAAREQSRFHCGRCGAAWNEDQRRAANQGGVLVHRHQEMSAAGPVGAIPRTRSFAMRVSAINNLFNTAADVGAAEWKARRAAQEENAEKEMLQFWWALPHQAAALDLTPLDQATICKRTLALDKGFIPRWADYITAGVDLGKNYGWFWVDAWDGCGRSHAIDYGPFDIHTRALGLESATHAALRELQGRFDQGWKLEDGEELRGPDVVAVDANWFESQDVVYAFCKASKGRWVPTIGRGTSQINAGRYERPKAQSKAIIGVGDGYHFVQNEAKGVFVIYIDADQWKAFVHERLAVAIEAPSAKTLYRAPWSEHLVAAKHLTAERKVQEFEPGIGVRYRWEKMRLDNHLFDCASLSAVMGHWMGARVVQTEVRPGPGTRESGTERMQMRMPDGRAYLITERT